MNGPRRVILKSAVPIFYAPFSAFARDSLSLSAASPSSLMSAFAAFAAFVPQAPRACKSAFRRSRKTIND